jgi:5'-3' exonuclease
MLERLVTDLDPDFICCAADDDWRPQWRVDLVESYKAHRVELEGEVDKADDILGPQVELAFELLEGCGVAVVGHEGYEAEDVIGTLAERAPGQVVIVSGDRDLFQLVRDPEICIFFPRRGMSEVDVVNETSIEKKYRIPGNRYLDFAVLRGDPSDGLPGVRGIGEKSAAALVRRYGSIEGVIQAARAGEAGAPLAKVRKELDYVERALKVTTIATELPIPDVDIRRPRRVDPGIIELADSHALGGALRRLVVALESDDA